jgi:Mor family transcriptional regulator
MRTFVNMTDQDKEKTKALLDKLDRIPDEIKNKPYMEFTPKDLRAIISLDFSCGVYAGMNKAFNKDMAIKTKFIKEKYCYYEKETQKHNDRRR